MISVVSPAYNEGANLQDVYERLRNALDDVGLRWEWVVVDDHSADDTFRVLSGIAAADTRVRGLRLSRNCGSHTAIRCAVHYAEGDAVALLASDLEDPPEVIQRMWAERGKGAQLVWGVRSVRHGGGPLDSRFARTYYWVMRHIGGVALPAGGDCFLIDRVVADALNRCPERHTSIFALLTWLGFRQAQITYDKGTRLRGASGWTFAKKVKLLLDSLVGFSNVLVSWLRVPMALAGVGAILAAAVATTSARVNPWAVLAIALSLAAVQLAALWAIGQYVWRALDEACGRPLWLIEAATFPACPKKPDDR